MSSGQLNNDYIPMKYVFFNNDIEIDRILCICRETEWKRTAKIKWTLKYVKDKKRGFVFGLFLDTYFRIIPIFKFGWLICQKFQWTG